MPEQILGPDGADPPQWSLLALPRTALTCLEPKSLLEAPPNGCGNTKMAAGDRAPNSALSAVKDPPRDRNSRTPDHNRTPTRRNPPIAETSIKLCNGWWAGQDSNLQPDRYERPALTIELPAQPGARREGIKRKNRAVAMIERRIHANRRGLRPVGSQQGARVGGTRAQPRSVAWARAYSRP
jgi:hypothetical protein